VRKQSFALTEELGENAIFLERDVGGPDSWASAVSEGAKAFRPDHRYG
jgi:hypothetical protein